MKSDLPSTISSLIRFLISSFINVILLFLITAFFHEILKLDEFLAYIISIVLVFALNFLMLKFYVYPSKEHQQNTSRQFIQTLGISICFRLLEIICFYLIHEVGNLNYLIAMALIQPTSFLIKFFVYRTVFRTAAD